MGVIRRIFTYPDRAVQRVGGGEQGLEPHFPYMTQKCKEIQLRQEATIGVPEHVLALRPLQGCERKDVSLTEQGATRQRRTAGAGTMLDLQQDGPPTE